MTFGEARDWLREHSGIVAREESIGRYYVKVRAKVGTRVIWYQEVTEKSAQF